jgi:hypothetical protein
MTAKKLSADALGNLIDQCWSLRRERLAAQWEVDRLKESEDKATADVGEALRAAKLDSAKGMAGNASFRRQQVAQIVNEAEFLPWAIKKANIDCLKVGVVGEAWRLRIAEGVKVPGVEGFLKETVTISGPK